MMADEIAKISSAAWLERLAQLAVRQGVHLSTLQQKDGRDLELIFASCGSDSRPIACSMSAAPMRC